MDSNENEPKYSNHVPAWQVFLFTLLTIGLYYFYWFYKTSVFIKKQNFDLNFEENKNLKEEEKNYEKTGSINPALRTFGLLIPIVSFYLVYKLFKEIYLFSKYNHVTPSQPSPGLATIFYFVGYMLDIIVVMPLLYLFIGLPFPILMPLLFYFSQKTLNDNWAKIDSNLPKKKFIQDRVSMGIFALILIFIFYLLFLSAPDYSTAIRISLPEDSGFTVTESQYLGYTSYLIEDEDYTFLVSGIMNYETVGKDEKIKQYTQGFCISYLYGEEKLEEVFSLFQTDKDRYDYEVNTCLVELEEYTIDIQDYETDDYYIHKRTLGVEFETGEELYTKFTVYVSKKSALFIVIAAAADDNEKFEQIGEREKIVRESIKEA
ncbi:MAG: hypothetical protein ABID38_04705 [Candidatus Diapherotrites archaeon]